MHRCTSLAEPKIINNQVSVGEGALISSTVKPNSTSLALKLTEGWFDSRFLLCSKRKKQVQSSPNNNHLYESKSTDYFPSLAVRIYSPVAAARRRKKRKEKQKLMLGRREKQVQAAQLQTDITVIRIKALIPRRLISQ